MNFRECGDCTACCDGRLVGNTFGNRFGEGKPCPFLVSKVCTIYKNRPKSCHDYQCAWTQLLVPEWMKPNQCGVMISVEWDTEKQFLRVIEMKETINYNVYQEIDKFCKENNTYYVKVPYASNHT